MRGDLTLHGVTQPVELPITLANGRYTGSVKLKQTDFGIAPVSIAGGTVKVKDVIEIVFEIVPAGTRTLRTLLRKTGDRSGDAAMATDG